MAKDEATAAFELLETFLDRLDADHVTYRLDRIRDSILVEVYLPRVHWEVEFFADGRIEVERYAATEDVLWLTKRDISELVELLDLDWEPPEAPATAGE